MDDSVLTMVFTRLASDPELDAMLARNPLGDGTEPAIFTAWATDDRPFPYCVLSWSFSPGDHWAKRNGSLSVDIWSAGSSSITAERIRNRIVELLDRRMLDAGEAGPVRFYLGPDGLIPEEPEVVHWTLGFNVVFWRREFVRQLTEGA